VDRHNTCVNKVSELISDLSSLGQAFQGVTNEYRPVYLGTAYGTHIK